MNSVPSSNRNGTIREVINRADDLQGACADLRRHNGFQLLEPVHPDLHILANGIFQRVSGIDLLAKTAGFTILTSQSIDPGSEFLALMC
jgi:hypothetical protein